MKKIVKNFGELEKVIDFVFDIPENENTKKVLAFYDSVDENTKTEDLQKVYAKMLPILMEIKNDSKKAATFDGEKKSDSKTEVKSFKWLRLNDYKPLKLSETTAEKVEKADKIIFHYSEKVKSYIEKNGITIDIMENGKIKHLEISDFNFTDNIDICSVMDINGDEIKLKSDTHNIIYYLYTDNFQNEIKNKVCCSDCGIPFKLYKKAE